MIQLCLLHKISCFLEFGIASRVIIAPNASPIQQRETIACPGVGGVDMYHHSRQVEVGLRYCDTYQLRLCVTSVVVTTLPATVVRSHDSMDVGSLSVQTSLDDELCVCKGSCVRATVALVASSRIGTPQ